MRTPTPPSPTIIDMLAPLRNLFVGADFDRFTDHLTCLMTSHDPACITQVWRTAEHERDYSRHRDFLAHCPLDPVELLAATAQTTGLLERTTTLSHGRDVLVCVLDDTMRRRALSPKLFGAAFHHDHAAGHGQTSKSWGQDLVMLGVCPHPLTPGLVRTHLCDSELWVPIKRSIEGGHDTLPYESKAALGALMLARQREHLPEQTERLVLADSLYAKAPFLNAVRRDPNTHVLGRLAHNRVVFQTPPPRQAGRPGAPRKYGQQVDWKAEFAQKSKAVELEMYGRRINARVWSMVGRVKKYGQDVLLVVSQLEYASKPSLFLCTDTSLEQTQVLELYGARFSIEEAIRDQVCELGLGKERARDAKVYQMQVCMKLVAGMLLEKLGERQPEEVRERLREPWRKQQPRATMGQLRRGLLWECWSGRGLFSCDRLARASGHNPRPTRDEAVA